VVKFLRFVGVLVFAFAGSSLSPIAAQAADPVCTINVTVSGSTVSGSGLGDVICINADNVIVDALGGDDTVIDNGENNTVNLGEGDDTYDGSEGVDVEVDGGPGDDFIDGTPGDDVIIGDDGDDNLLGEAGEDTLLGGDGDDLVTGGVALDSIDGGPGLNVCDFTAGETLTATCTYDDDAPQVSEVTFSKTAIDSGPAAATVSVKVRIGDAIGTRMIVLTCQPNEGFGAWSEVYVSLNGDINRGGADVSGNIGNIRDFTFDLPLTFRRGMAPGAYQCTLDLADQIGNREKTEIGTIQVKRTGSGFDDDAPVFTLLSPEEKIADVTNRDWFVPVTYRVSDATGLESAGLQCIGERLRNDSSLQVDRYGVITASETTTTSGNLRNLTVSTRIRFKQGWYPGEYKCYAVTRDSLLNFASENEPVLVVTVKRTGSGHDDKGPLVTNFSTSVPEVEVGSADAKFDLSVRVRDVSGVDHLIIGCTAGSIKTTMPSVTASFQGNGGGVPNGTFQGVTYSSDGSSKDFLTTFKVTVRAGSKPGKYNCYLQGAFDAKGNSTIDVNTDDGPILLGSFIVKRTPISQPSAPQNLAFESAGPSKGKLTWNVPEFIGSPVLYAYLAEYSTDGVVWKKFLGGGATKLTSLDVSGLLGGKNYWIRVRGENGGTRNQTQYIEYMDLNWEVISVRTDAAVAPVAPTTLSVKAPKGSVTLSWKAPVDNGGSVVRDYVVEYSKNGSASWFKVIKAKSNATYVKIPGLRAKTTYNFRVYAVSSAGTSLASKVLKVTTK
jgi:Ca2+-binding RTX toxin-like protein